MCVFHCFIFFAGKAEGPGRSKAGLNAVVCHRPGQIWIIWGCPVLASCSHSDGFHALGANTGLLGLS